MWPITPIFEPAICGGEYVEEYYLLFILTYLLTMASVREIEISWTEDEAFLPKGEELDGIRQRFMHVFQTAIAGLVRDLAVLLEDDPLR